MTIIGRPGPSGRLITDITGGNALAKWNHQLGTDSSIQLRAYYDRTQRDDPAFLDDLDTVDVDFQHWLPLPLRQDLMWGLNYRLTSNRNQSKVLFNLNPANAVDHLISLFIQDRITLLDSLRLSLGTKLERNTFSGFEIQPSARLGWTPLSSQTVWAAVSRAVRVPTRLERDVAIAVSDPADDPRAELLGNRAYGAEQLLAYELGYRWNPSAMLSADVAGFWSVYHGLSSLELADPVSQPDGRAVIPIVNQNLTDGVAKGFEVSVKFSPVDFWQLSARYSNLVLTLDPRGQDLNRGEQLEGASPRHQVGLTSFLDLPGHFQVNAVFRYVSALRGSPDALPGEEIPAYAELDAQVSWNGWKPLTVSVVGQNLLHAHHREFFGGAQAQRGVYAKLAARF